MTQDEKDGKEWESIVARQDTHTYVYSYRGFKMAIATYNFQKRLRRDIKLMAVTDEAFALYAKAVPTKTLRWEYAQEATCEYFMDVSAEAIKGVIDTLWTVYENHL